ncbi:MAG: T9SS type A sorting domain-containing protein [Bacteroidia bacterium]|nr:T9SS type A sorting domain-containing protein [Bacteroidia bacterium]
MENYLIELLNDAPECGTGSNSGSENWCSMNNIASPWISESILWQFTNGSYIEGNGLDYMLLHNLYRLVFHPGSYTPNPHSYETFNYPIHAQLNNGSLGSEFNPYVNRTSNMIEAENIIRTGADVTYIAGDRIRFLPDFRIDSDAHFEAIIDPSIAVGTPYLEVTPPCNSDIICYLLTNKQLNILPEDDSQTIKSDISSSINLYPNPCDGWFIIETPYSIDQSTIELSDIIGKPVNYNIAQYGENSYKIKITDNIKGIYTVRLINNSTINNWKVIVK